MEPTAVPTVTVTPTDVPTATPTETATPTPTPVEEEEPVPTPTPEPVDETLDSDTDGIPDYMEDEIGTNPNDPDTDGDGLEDYLEVMVGYDPTNQDTDDNGILDGEEDLDNDGLCNVNELSLETDIFSEDTDCDKLKDGEEFYTYGTNPKNPDSDDDGILDGDEIAIGKDPTDPSDATIRIEQTKVQEITNEEDPAISSVEVTICLANSIDISLKIRDMYNVDIRTTNVPGRIGSPLSFECEEDFDTATVVIHYSEAALGDTAESDLGILWYDEEDGIFVEQTQAILDSSNNKITVELEHFSEYVLVDLSLFRAVVPQVYTVDDSLVSDPIHYNVTFAVDTSSNMDMSERLAAIETINTVLGTLEAGDRVSFISQTGYDYSYSRFVDAANVRSIPSSWQSNIRGQQGSGRSNLAPYNDVAEDNFFTCNLPEDGNKNIIIYLTDENSTYSTSYGGVHVLIEHSYSYYAVFVGDTYNQTLANICNNRGGGAYMAGSPEVEQIIFHGGNGESIFTDEDEDGLPDILEEEGMYDLNGNQVYYSDPTVADTDGDGLTDGEEMGTMISIRRADEDHVQFGGTYMELSEVSNSQYADFEQLIPENPGEICFVFDVQSDPSNPDTDGDGLSDFDDDRKTVINPHMNYIFYSSSGNWYDVNGFENEMRFRVQLFEKNNRDYEVYEVNTVLEFVEKWNSMGTGDEVRYIIDEVYIIAHGAAPAVNPEEDLFYEYSIHLNDNELIGVMDVYDQLNSKSINAIYLQFCWGGSCCEGNTWCLAEAFLSFMNVDRVYACDGKSYNDYYISDIMIEDLLVRRLLNAGWISYNFTWGNWTLRSFAEDNNEPGYKCFYYDESGNKCCDLLGELVWQM